MGRIYLAHEWGSVVGLYENSKEPTDFIKCGNFLAGFSNIIMLHTLVLEVKTAFEVLIFLIVLEIRLIINSKKKSSSLVEKKCPVCVPDTCHPPYYSALMLCCLRTYHATEIQPLIFRGWLDKVKLMYAY
jgi:hypothetical protein